MSREKANRMQKLKQRKVFLGEFPDEQDITGPIGVTGNQPSFTGRYLLYIIIKIK